MHDGACPPFSLRFSWNEKGKMVFELVYAILLFALTYVLMLVFSKYRPQIAIGSAVIFIVTGMLPLNQIVEAIDSTS